ncbi:MAG: hypothetical protein ACFFCD_15595 [Promethearchaeota archaeon]
MSRRIWIANKWQKITAKIKRELNERTVLPSLFLGVFVYLLVSYLFAATEFYRISLELVGQSSARNAIFTFNIPWILSTYSSEIFNSWFKQIVYQGIAGGATGSFIKEEVRSSVVICSSTLLFYTIVVLVSNISDIGMVFLFLIKELLIGVTGGIIGIHFYRELSEEHLKNDENS